MTYVMPGKGLVMEFTLAGYDLLPFVNVMRIFESVCKQYITAQVIIFDTDNLMETLGVTAGTPATMSMMAPPNDRLYQPGGMTVLKMKGEPAPGTLQFQTYTIDFVGPEYWQDRLNTVRNTFQQIQGTAAIAAIWGQYIGTPFSVDSSSSGMIGNENQSDSQNGKKPFTAMYDIMKKLAGGQGNWLLYHDRDSARINQLEAMLDSAELEQYIQSEIWGQTFDPQNIYRTIIVAQMQAGRGDGGRSSGKDLAKFASQTLSVMDVGLGQIQQTGMQAIQSGAMGALGGGGQYGGRANRQTINTSGIPAAVSAIAKTVGEGSFSASVRNGPQIALKVPLQTGINATVGKCIDVQLLPPTIDPINTYALNGSWMVADLCHECYQDDRELNATTSMQCVHKP